MTITVPGREGKYTKSDEKILEFMESHTDEFLFMSIGEVAKRLEVSEATISRAARHLGYRDFKEMKNEIIGQKTGKGAAGKIAGTLLKTQGFDIGKWFAMQQECLSSTLENFDQKEFSRAVSQIQSARNIYIHGKNASASSAQLLFFRLRRLGYKVFMVPSGGSEVIEGIVHAGEGDLVIIFSYSKVSVEGKMILEYAKTAGYTTMAFTSRRYAPQEQRADINLYVYRGEKEEFHSMTAPAAMIDALILALSEKDQGDNAQNLLKIQKLKEKFKQK